MGHAQGGTDERQAADERELQSRLRRLAEERRWETVANKALRVGDVIDSGWCGTKTIVAIRPYGNGPNADVVFALVDWEPGPTRGFSLEKGGLTKRLAR
jgi:hypothetical protein